jgi:hypothetical protein
LCLRTPRFGRSDSDTTLDCGQGLPLAVGVDRFLWLLKKSFWIDVEKSAYHQLSQNEKGGDNPVRDTYPASLIFDLSCCGRAGTQVFCLR